MTVARRLTRCVWIASVSLIIQSCGERITSVVPAVPAKPERIEFSLGLRGARVISDMSRESAWIQTSSRVFRVTTAGLSELYDDEDPDTLIPPTKASLHVLMGPLRDEVTLLRESSRLFRCGTSGIGPSLDLDYAGLTSPWPITWIDGSVLLVRHGPMPDDGESDAVDSGSLGSVGGYDGEGADNEHVAAEEVAADRRLRCRLAALRLIPGVGHLKSIDWDCELEFTPTGGVARHDAVVVWDLEGEIACVERASGKVLWRSQRIDIQSAAFESFDSDSDLLGVSYFGGLFRISAIDGTVSELSGLEFEQSFLEATPSGSAFLAEGSGRIAVVSWQDPKKVRRRARIDQGVYYAVPLGDEHALVRTDQECGVSNSGGMRIVPIIPVGEK